MNQYLGIVNGIKTLFTAITTSLGVADAGKIPATNAQGKLGNKLLPVVEVTVDFTVPAHSRTFTVSLTGAVPGNPVFAMPSLNMPAGVQADELEMDPFTCSAYASNTDEVTITVTACRPNTRLFEQRTIALLY
jgi:hypothetical protein